MSDKDKRSSLLWCGMNYVRKNLIVAALRSIINERIEVHGPIL